MNGIYDNFDEYPVGHNHGVAVPAYEIKHERPERKPGNVQKLTTRNDIYWDGVTTFEIAYPCFYVEAFDEHRLLTRDRNGHPIRVEDKDVPNGMHFPGDAEHPRGHMPGHYATEDPILHPYDPYLDPNNGWYHWYPHKFLDPKGFLRTHGHACTGRHEVCHDYFARPHYHGRAPICVNCLHHAKPIQLWDEWYRKGEMKVYALPIDKRHEDHGHTRWTETIDDIEIGQPPRPGHTEKSEQHVVRVFLSELSSSQDMANLDLWYDVKIRAPYVYYNTQTQTYREGAFDGPPAPQANEVMKYRPKTDTVVKGRMFIDPDVDNRMSW
jgi:hypothetical protein